MKQSDIEKLKVVIQLSSRSEEINYDLKIGTDEQAPTEEIVTKAVANIVMNIDTNGWEKLDEDYDVGKFFAAIFNAIYINARWTKWDAPESTSVAESLKSMIDYLDKDGRLKFEPSDE